MDYSGDGRPHALHIWKDFNYKVDIHVYWIPYDGCCSFRNHDVVHSIKDEFLVIAVSTDNYTGFPYIRSWRKAGEGEILSK